MKLSEAIEALCLATRAEGRSRRTVSSYREKLGYLVRFLGDVDVESVTVHDLRRYIAAMRDQATIYVDHPQHEEQARGLSPFTIHSRGRALKRLFNWLEQEGEITANPVRLIRLSKPKRDEPKGISVQDFVALLEACDGDRLIDLRDRAMILFLYDTGCRVGGLVNLRVGHVDFTEMLATVKEKRGKARRVPFTEITRDALLDWLKARPRGRGSWFFVGLGTHSTGPMTAQSVQQAIKRRGDKAGVSGPINPHAFRHGFARAFLLGGGDLAALSDLMGHEEISTTKAWYGIFTTRELQEKHRRYSPVIQALGEQEKNNERQCTDSESVRGGSNPPPPA